MAGISFRDALLYGLRKVLQTLYQTTKFIICFTLASQWAGTGMTPQIEPIITLYNTIIFTTLTEFQ